MPFTYVPFWATLARLRLELSSAMEERADELLACAAIWAAGVPTFAPLEPGLRSASHWSAERHPQTPGCSAEHARTHPPHRLERSKTPPTQAEMLSRNLIGAPLAVSLLSIVRVAGKRCQSPRRRRKARAPACLQRSNSVWPGSPEHATAFRISLGGDGNVDLEVTEACGRWKFLTV